jgi:hypothetical protein
MPSFSKCERIIQAYWPAVIVAAVALIAALNALGAKLTR